MASNWYFQSLGNVIGPISSAELRQRAVQGQIDANTMVAKDEPDRWVRADRVTGLIPPPDAHEAAASPSPAAADSAADLATPAPMLSGILHSAPPAPKSGRKTLEYKVLTPKDKSFAGKFDLDKLEESLNAHAQAGWRVVGVVCGSIHGLTSATRSELVIVLER